MTESLVRAVLVTGAGSGIGKATVKYLVFRNFFVYATDIDEESLKEFFGVLTTFRLCDGRKLTLQILHMV